MSDLLPSPDLSSDRPISSLSEDLLGRGGFAVALANAFIEWKGKDSLVVALYGPWGIGKSSVKNMVLELIRKHGDDPAIVEFNPWAWSGRDRIFYAFFEEVGIVIGKGPDKQQAKALATRWRKYGARLSFAGIAVNAIKMGTQAVGIPVVPLVLDGMATGAKQISELAEGAAKAHQAASEDEPLEELKKGLSETLSGLKAPLMVVMDDVDRLTKEETRTLFQLIKANADFPRVVYFLLFDRAVVEKALDGEGGSSGREYLEKIVQAGFDLPKHDQADLDRMLYEGLSRLLGFGGSERTFDADRWGKLHHYGLRPILATPRDVNRFLSSLSFTVGLFFRDKALEVNVIDMIGVEALRMFEPDLYHQLPGRRDQLLGGGHSYLSGRDDREERKRNVEAFVEEAAEAHRPGVRAILRELFPSIDWLLMGHGEGQGFEARWMRDLRICHGDLFDRYFALAVPKGELPVSVIDRLLSVAKNRDEIRHELSILKDEGRLVDALNRLAAYTSEMDLDGAAQFITAIMDVGDSLPTRGAGMFEVGPDMTAYFIISDLLMRETDRAVRSRLAFDALSATDGLYLPVQVVTLDKDRREENDVSHPPFLDDRSWARARRLCLAKIRAAAEDGRLLGPNLETYLWRWRDLEGDAAPRKYVGKLASSSEGALPLLRCLTQEVRSISSGSVTMRVDSRINPKTLEQFVPVAKLRSKLGPLLADDVPEGLASLAADYRDELSALRIALDPERRKSPSHPNDINEAARIDLNSASMEELVDLPGIGQDLAARIIERRPFEQMDDLTNVKGVGEKKLAQLRKLVRV